MQVASLSNTHVATQIRAQEASPQNVTETEELRSVANEENIAFNDPSRIEEIFNTLTRELSERETDDREMALYKSMHPTYLQDETPQFESELVRRRIEEEKAMLTNGESSRATEAEDEDEDRSKNNNAINSQNQLELNSFVNDFTTLFYSGYRPIDLKI